MQFDAGRAAQNMMIAAWSLGVGTCPNTPIDESTLKQLLELPAEAAIPTILSLGYPAASEPKPRPRADPARVLDRVNRLPLQQILRSETYGG
ncbi:MAG: nitroreductase family protein, partial [Candidatus Rokuibacteriota bacterium]